MKFKQVTYSGLKEKNDKEVKEIVDNVERAININIDFFQIERFPFSIKFLQSRKEINKEKGKNTPNWIVGWVSGKPETIFVLAPWAFEKESCHDRKEFSKVIIHEISHLFLKRFNSSPMPVWIKEGIATNIAEQERQLEEIELYKMFLDRVLESQYGGGKFKGKIYTLSYWWIRFLIENYGKRKLLDYIARIDKRDKDLFFEIYGESLTKMKIDFIDYLKEVERR
jgi:hypothetical protein